MLKEERGYVGLLHEHSSFGGRSSHDSHSTRWTHDWCALALEGLDRYSLQLLLSIIDLAVLEIPLWLLWERIATLMWLNRSVGRAVDHGRA